MKKMRWYVLQVLTGSELEAQRQLEANGIDAVVLRETALIRRRGQWHEETRILFPGYVFLFMHYTTAEHYIIKGIPGAIRLLPKDQPMPMPPEDCTWLIMCAGEDILPPSEVSFDGDEPVIRSGPLEAMEEYIVRYDRHRRKAMLRIPVLGEYKDIVLSILPVSRQKPEPDRD